MARQVTITRLSVRNSLKAWGRLLILVLLLGSAIVARSSVYLVQEGLCEEAESAVTGGSLPNDFNVVALSPSTAYSPDMLGHYLMGLLRTSYRRITAIVGYGERYLGPSGEIWVVAPYTGAHRSLGGADVPQNWYEYLLGDYPDEAGEVAVPAPFADAHDIEIGDEVSLRDLSGEKETVFTVSAVYEPKGQGPFYEYFLTWMHIPPALHAYTGRYDMGGEPDVMLNFIVARLNAQQIGILRSWGEDLKTGATGTIVQEFVDPKERMASLARDVYGSRSGAVNLGSGLVGVAVLVVLLVAMVERRREAAVYKMVGMNSYMTLTVFVLELAAAVGLAMALAAPTYWLLAMRYILDVHAATTGIVWPPFVTSALLCVGVVALGSLYPLGLTSVGTPNQLLTNQRLFLFRRKQTLRGWTD